MLSVDQANFVVLPGIRWGGGAVVRLFLIFSKIYLQIPVNSFLLNISGQILKLNYFLNRWLIF